MNEEFNAKLKLLIKSEKALLSLEMKKRSRQTLFVTLALIAVLISLVMLNITVYLYLTSRYSNLEAAGILTALNITIALIFFIIASKQERGAEAEAIEDIRDYAWEQVHTDLNVVKEDVKAFKNSVVNVKQTVDSFANGDTFGIKKIIPIITTLIDLTKKK